MRQSCQTPLVLQAGFSPRLALYLFGIHLAALGVSLALPLGAWRWGLAAAIGASALHGALTHLWPRLPWAIDRVVWDAEGRWWLHEASGRVRAARLASSTFVCPALVVLDFRVGLWHRPTLALGEDVLGADALRRLRQRLRLLGGEAERRAPGQDRAPESMS